MRELRFPPIEIRDERMFLRVEALRDDGTPIYAEGFVQVAGQLQQSGASSLPVAVNPWRLSHEDIDRTYAQLLCTLRAVE